MLYMITDFLPVSSTLCLALSSKGLLVSLTGLKSPREFKRFRLLHLAKILPAESKASSCVFSAETRRQPGSTTRTA
ncbi:hypothetical protein PHISP_00830 [Aspergillus sp. HF37]|nr:hypothetical protein PHISP_00830 [Aspergillus sp. HF37]